MKCEIHEIQYVKRLNAAGHYYIKKQCLFCGETPSGTIKIKDIGGKENLILLEDYNEGLFKDWESDFLEELKEKQSIRYEEEQKIYKEKQKEQRNKDRLEWLEKSKPYYNSDIWKLKREFVLKRDNYICQACLSNTANQVHHLTYKHFANEPLFELTSVCKTCHDKITLLDNV